MTRERLALPVVAFMAGRFMDEMPGMRFGHAGTIVEGRADTTAEKIERMEAAGISVAERIEDIPRLLPRQRIAASEGLGITTWRCSSASTSTSRCRPTRR